MGQKQTTIVERTCDICYLGNQQLMPLAKLACSKKCALQILHKDMCDLPKQEEVFTETNVPVDMNKVN